VGVTLRFGNLVLSLQFWYWDPVRLAVYWVFVGKTKIGKNCWSRSTGILRTTHAN
jgi:hypothetical protein